MSKRYDAAEEMIAAAIGCLIVVGVAGPSERLMAKRLSPSWTLCYIRKHLGDMDSVAAAMETKTRTQ